MSLLWDPEEEERNLRALAEVKKALESLRDAQSITHHHAALGCISEALKSARYAEVLLIEAGKR